MNERIYKQEVNPIKCDPIIIDLPQFKAEFVRFESSKDGKKFFVVYEIKEIKK